METALTQSSSVRRMSFIKNIIKKDLHGGGGGMGGDSQVIGFLVQIANEGFLSFPPELPCHSKLVRVRPISGLSECYETFQSTFSGRR